MNILERRFAEAGVDVEELNKAIRINSSGTLLCDLPTNCNLSDILLMCMTWEETIQGHDYWSEICINLRSKGL